MSTHVVFESVTIHGQPQLKSFQSGKSLVEFEVTQENGYGQNKKDPFIFKIKAWGDLADQISKLGEGTKLNVYGRLTTGTYEWQGQKKTKQETIANAIDVRTATAPKPAQPEYDDSQVPF